MKSVPLARFARPRPAALKLTPVMLNVDLPVSLNVSLSWSPASRLTPLNEASWAVVGIWARMSLYGFPRLRRTDCADRSMPGAEGVEKLTDDGPVPLIPPPAATDPTV